MHILHIVPTYLPAHRYGGPIVSVHALNKWLVKLGIEVTVYTTNADGEGTLNVPLGTSVDRDGVRVFYFPVSFPRSWYYSPAMNAALRRHGNEFDLFHITSVFLAASFFGARFAKLHKKPCIVSPRGSLMRVPLHGRSALLKSVYISAIEHKNLERADAIHFTAAVEEDEYREAKFPLHESFIIPNSFEMEVSAPLEKAIAFRKAHDISIDADVALSFGRLSWKKGFDTLIPAFAEVVKNNSRAVLVIAGVDDEGYRPTLEHLIREHGIERQTRIIIGKDPVTGDEKIGAFAAADVFALPSYSENFGMSVLEALYLGTPVVISDGVGLSEALKKNKAGFVVKKENAAVAEAITKAFAYDEKTKEMIRNGQDLIRKKFSGEAVARQFVEAYEELIANGARQ